MRGRIHLEVRIRLFLDLRLTRKNEPPLRLLYWVMCIIDILLVMMVHFIH